MFSTEKSYYQFVAQKCRNDTNDTQCASPEEIDEYISDIQIEHWTQEEHVDFTIYNTKPVFSYLKHISSQLLNPKHTENYIITFKVNEIETEDDWFDFGQQNNFEYYNLEKEIKQTKLIEAQSGKYLYISRYHYSEVITKHTRRIFNFFDMIGAMGGVLELFVGIFGLVFFNLGKHLAIMRLM